MELLFPASSPHYAHECTSATKILATPVLKDVTNILRHLAEPTEWLKKATKLLSNNDANYTSVYELILLRIVSYYN